MLKLQIVSRSYGKTRALNGFSYTFHHGVYGLLGPNGSGKTTLLNILSDNLRADCGTVTWNGVPPTEKVRARVGYAPQFCELYPSMTALDFLRYMAVIKACDRKKAEEQIRKLLAYFALDGVMHSKIGSFSGGMKQRLLLIQAFLGEPSLVLLDEPTAGLDPLQRMLVHRLIQTQAHDKIILYATHILPDLQDLCEDVLFLKRGELIHVSHAQDDLEDSYLRLFDTDEADMV